MKLLNESIFTARAFASGVFIQSSWLWLAGLLIDNFQAPWLACLLVSLLIG